jgi:aminomethyltransferase
VADPLERTPLYELQRELGARFGPFAGYEMALQFREGLRAEHLWTRAHAGLFDVSHMGQLRAGGPELESSLEGALPVDFEGWPEGLQRYTLLLNARGGIEDDLMLARLDGEVALVVNAACKDKDLAQLRRLCPGIAFEPLDHALLALQGPSSEAVLATLRPEVAALGFMHAMRCELDGARCLITRSGYTGEDGFEISLPAAEAPGLARALLAHAEVKPIGLGARDTLRLEAALPLYGQDMDADTTPQEAGLAWAIAPGRRASGAKAGGFPGAEHVLREQREGTSRRFVGLVGAERVPIRHGAALADDSGREMGVVTSGTVSPSLERPIMLAYLASAIDESAELFALVRGQRHRVALARLPFVPKRYKR